MLTAHQRATFAQRLLSAESTHEWIAPLTEVHPGVGLGDAYAIAREVRDLKVAGGERVVGRKIGITSAPMRELAGADEPDFGFLYDGWQVSQGSGIARSDLNSPSVEIEIAFVLGGALEGDHVTAEDVARATDHVCPAIEVVDTRYSKRGPGPLVVDNVADAAWCGRFVLAESRRRLHDLDVANVNGSLIIDGVTHQTGSSAAVMDNPLNAVAWLAIKLHSFGDRLTEGDIVLSGSFIRAVPIEANQVVTASFEGWAELTLEVTP